MRGKNTQINITLTQIRALMATAENKSFAKAAETLFVSQPTVTYRLLPDKDIGKRTRCAAICPRRSFGGVDPRWPDVL